MTNKIDKIKAARVAFRAWERAVIAAQEALGSNPSEGIMHGAGTCVMTSAPRYKYENPDFACSECKGRGKADWKFCAFCGSEIMRFDDPVLKDGENKTMTVEITHLVQPPVHLNLKVKKVRR